MRIFSFVCFFSLVVGQVWAQPLLIAHRGASSLAPENTVASAKLAWELGADAVEIDVHLSEDGQVMVIHDKGTNRTADKKLTIKSTHSSDLRRLDVGSWKDAKYKGEKIPFLSEIIETIPEGKILVVEIKCGPEVIPALKKVVNASEKKDQIEFIGFSWETILAIKKQLPNQAAYWLSATKKGLKEKMQQAAEVGLDGVDLQARIIDQETMKLANELELDVLCWTVDDPKEAKRLADLGVKGITTNRPAWLREQVDELQ